MTHRPARHLDERRIDALVADLRTAIGHDAVSVELSERRTASSDWAHMSPLLMAHLPATVADVVAWPASPEDIATAVAIAHRHRVPVTPRGKGTGNYGQAVPLQGGLVLDLQRCQRILEVGDGWMHVDPGAKFVVMEQAARRAGQELTQIPSTVGSTVGGYLAGGSGGTGSIESGWNWEGFVERMEVVPCTDEAVAVPVEGSDTRPFIHAYGTTGLISSATVRLVPQRRWTGLFASFPTFDAAIAAGRSVIATDPRPRLISIDDVETVATFVDDPCIPKGRASLRAIVEAGTVGAASRAVTDVGGVVESVRSDAPPLLISLSFNHVTHRARKARPELVHLQASGRGLVERTDEVKAVYPETLVHLDGFKTREGPGFIALIMCVFEGEEALYDGVRRLEELDVRVNDPHVWQLHRDLELYWPAAERFDPAGLLNPGKLPPPAG